MCRHLAYLGPTVPLSFVLLDPPHSILRQSWAPQQMRGGSTVNADGFGAGWFAADGVARRYRRDCPIWADASLPDLAASIRAGAILAAVRSATAGMGRGEGACAPFTDGRTLFSHNGAVAGWPSSLTGLASALSPADLMTLPAATDSALLWALVRARLVAGATPAGALASVVIDVADAAPGSRLNLLLTDAEVIVATTCGHSLWTRAADDAVMVSSEPLDLQDRTWTQVADRCLVVARRRDLSICPLDDKGWS